MSDLTDAVARLNARIDALESRVSMLEHPSMAPRAVPVQPSPLQQAAHVERALLLVQAGGSFSVIGKALLGIAGAYVLRAVAEAGAFPMLVVVALALAYAGIWLVWATQAVEWERFAATIYATTSALILAPMLWELTLRFRVLHPPVTAGVLCIFVIAASIRAWKHNQASIFWVISVTAILTSLVLMVATRDMVPFVWALLLMAFLCEYAAGRNHWLSARPLVAIAADAAVGALIFVYSRPEAAVSSNYKVVSLALLLVTGSILFLIYGASILVRTTLLRHSITIFEIVQTVIAFLLLGIDVHKFGTDMGVLIFGVACLLFSFAGYMVVFVRFDSFSERRNYHVYATWSASLFLLGSFLLLSSRWLMLWLCVAAVVSTFAGTRMLRVTPQFHGLVYLTVAAFASGFMSYASRAFVGSFPAPLSWIIWTVWTAAIFCYAIAWRSQGSTWGPQLLRLFFAVLVVSSMTALLIAALVHILAFGVAPNPPHIAVIRTLAICVTTLALAYGGSRWRRTELVWIAYGALALVAMKLLVEDMRHGHPGFIAASIFLYASALLLVPRLVRHGPEI